MTTPPATVCVCVCMCVCAAGPSHSPAGVPQMREYVSRVLMMVASVSETEADSIMSKADWQGGALVGVWEEALAQVIQRQNLCNHPS